MNLPVDKKLVMLRLIRLVAVLDGNYSSEVCVGPWRNTCCITDAELITLVLKKIESPDKIESTNATERTGLYV